MTIPDDPRRDRAADPSPSSDDAEDRAAILRRRARFIASAIAGLGIAAGCSDPQPCLKVAPPEDAGAMDAGTSDASDSDASAGAEAPPSPPPAPSASPDAGAQDAGESGGDAGTPDGGATDAGVKATAPRSTGGSGGQTPRACLKALPHPCLKRAPTNDDF